jgi:hypothetical protein
LKESPGWTFTDHCCRSCFGRVLRCAEVYRCATCEVETTGRPDGICGCGMPGFKGLAKCGPNTLVRPENPARVVIHVGDDTKGRP